MCRWMSSSRGMYVGSYAYRILQNGCREQHSTHDSPLNFDLTLGAIRLVQSGFKVQS